MHPSLPETESRPMPGPPGPRTTQVVLKLPVDPNPFQWPKVTVRWSVTSSWPMATEVIVVLSQFGCSGSVPPTEMDTAAAPLWSLWWV